MVVEVLDADGSVQRTEEFSIQEIRDAQTHVPVSYAVRRQPGGSTIEVDLPYGTPVYTVLRDLAGIGEDISYVELEKPNSSYTTVLDASRGELSQTGSPGYAFGADSPDFYDENGSVAFMRPLRSGSGQDRKDPDDVNGNDVYLAYPGRSIVMQVHLSGRPALRPVVSVDKTSVKAGEPVRFGVRYSDGRRPGEPATYAWSFGDGAVPETCPATSTDPGPSHSYAAGSWTAHVTVCGSNGTKGTSTNEVRIVVDAKKPTKPGTGPSGPADGPKNGPRDGAPGGPGKNSNGAPNGEDGVGDSAGDGAQNGQDGRQGKPAEAGTGDVRVDGVLLDASSAVAVTVPAAPSAPTAAVSPRRATKIPTDWRRLLVLLPVVLLAAGAARQTPWLTRRFPELPWRRV